MIVEDERDEYSGDHAMQIDPEEVPTRPRRAEVYDRPVEEEIKIERDHDAVAEYMDRYNMVTCPIIHNQLKQDLVKHLWSMRSHR